MKHATSGRWVIAAIGTLMALVAAAASAQQETNNVASQKEVVSFGLGCFWCSEAVFQRVDGVLSVKSGYQGGALPNPTYKQVCTGETGHAEVIRVEYDPAKVTLDDLLDVFWQAHDPTQVNGQGADHGTQYRSAIFCSSAAQKTVAEAARAKAQASGKFAKKIATEIAVDTTFYPAEDYHQDFYNQNRSYPYCRMVIVPKLKKLGIEDKSP